MLKVNSWDKMEEILNGNLGWTSVSPVKLTLNDYGKESETNVK